MTAREKDAAVQSLQSQDLSLGAIAKHLGVGKGSIDAVNNRLKGRTAKKNSRSVGVGRASLTAPAGRAADESPAVVSVHSSRKRGGIMGGKPSKALREARAGEGVETPPILISRAAAFDPIPGIEPIGFMDLNARTCRWPVSGLYGREHIFCGASCGFEVSYCSAHARLAFQPPRERKVA
jgi:GcrA cell cycle regulator